MIIIGVVLFELIVFFHEGGHFITAKLSGVKVNEFSVGMGPKLFSFTKGETTYSLRILPIGGYCAMEGEDEDSENPRAFNNAKIFKRMIIIVAGAFMNILFGILLMMITLLPQDYFSSTTVSSFSELSYTQATGLKSGDKILRLNDYNIYSEKDFSFALYTLKTTDVDGSEFSIYTEDCLWQLYDNYLKIVNKDTPTDVHQSVINTWVEGNEAINICTDKQSAYKTMCKYIDKMNESAGVDKPQDYPQIEEQKTRVRYRTDITVERDGKELVLKDVDFLTLKASKDSDEAIISTDFYVEPVEKTFTSLISETFRQTLSVVRMVWYGFVGLVSGQFGFNEISGPVGLVSAVSDVAAVGLEKSFGDAVMNIIYVMMIISVNLGIVNMLPFPALDGGKFVFLLIEGIFRRPIPRKVESVINAAGLILFLLLMAVVTVKDVWQLFV